MTVQLLASWYSDLQYVHTYIRWGNVTYVCTSPYGADAIDIYSGVVGGLPNITIRSYSGCFVVARAYNFKPLSTSSIKVAICTYIKPPLSTRSC